MSGVRRRGCSSRAGPREGSERVDVCWRYHDPRWVLYIRRRFVLHRVGPPHQRASDNATAASKPFVAPSSDYVSSSPLWAQRRPSWHSSEAQRPAQASSRGSTVHLRWHMRIRCRLRQLSESFVSATQIDCRARTFITDNHMCNAQVSTTLASSSIRSKRQ